MDIYSAIVIITVLLLAVTVTDICTNRVISKRTRRNSVLVCFCIGFAIFFEWAALKLDRSDSLHRWIKKLLKCSSSLRRR